MIGMNFTVKWFDLEFESFSFRRTGMRKLFTVVEIEPNSRYEYFRRCAFEYISSIFAMMNLIFLNLCILNEVRCN